MVSSRKRTAKIAATAPAPSMAAEDLAFTASSRISVLARRTSEPTETGNRKFRDIRIRESAGKTDQKRDVTRLSLDALQVHCHGAGCCAHIRAGDNNITVAGGVDALIQADASREGGV